jgi:hypothetical protein
VGANSASASRSYRDNWDRVFGKKQQTVITDHEIDEVIASAKPALDPLRSLSDEDFAKLEPLAEEVIQDALDRGRGDAEAFERRGNGSK